MSMPWGFFAGFMIAGAAFTGRAAANWRELTAFGPICGDPMLHCGWCYAAAASLLAAAVSLAFALAQSRRTAAIRAVAAA
jgi:hypothetical protein